MNRTDRLAAILTQLQGKTVITAQEIAQRFDISLRTVYRDIRALEEAGVPIGAEAGKGYYMLEGYRLPPVMFSKEEAGAILVASKLIESQTDESFKRNFNDALIKIRAVLRQQEKGYLETLEQQVAVVAPTRPKIPGFPDNFLSDIQNALVYKHVLQFDYYSNYSGEYNRRAVEPIGLFNYTNRWHLVAHCQLRKGVRDFRLDRMAKLSLTGQQFEKDYTEEYKQYFKRFDLGQETTAVKLAVEKSLTRYIGDMKYYHGFAGEKDCGDVVEMDFMVREISYFGRWMLMFGNSARIIEPESLRVHMAELVKKLATHYQV